MKVNVVKFSRPLLMITEDAETNPRFQPVYGFILKRLNAHYATDIDDYVSYLATLHYGENGGDFKITYDRSPYLPDFVTKKGVRHELTDKWAVTTGRKIRAKIDLTYEILMVEVDTELYNSYGEDDFIFEEGFFKELKAVEEYGNSHK